MLMSNSAIAQLDPKPVWEAFAGLAAVPRPSKKEEQVRAHLRNWANQHRLTFREDAVGNILILVPATPGHEHAPTVVLQGHVDMVCEKNTGTEHDFDRDPIQLVLDRDGPSGPAVVRAAGTTLGADNGIGVALALAAATAPDVVHGPLEVLCTVDEEAGMTGARALTPEFVQGRRLLNLDSEEDDALFIGCAGGRDTTVQFEFKTAARPKTAEIARLTIAGLRGGHSGCDIHLNRLSAIKLLVQTLTGNDHVEGGLPVQLADLRGGSKRNVIPREAAAVVCGPKGTLLKLRHAAEQLQVIAHRAGEEACAIHVEAGISSDAPAVLSRKDSQRLLTTLTALPHGVLATVPEIPGLVQTSNSTSTVKVERGPGTLTVTIGCLSRSSSSVQLHTALQQIDAIGALAGATTFHNEGYPGWQPNVDSPLLALGRRLYEQVFGTAPKITAIHAGLECGVIDSRIGAGTMDMLSFGPHITGAHSPDERVYVESVQKMWTYLRAMLAELAK
jgi:dipeptidase D